MFASLNSNGRWPIVKSSIRYQCLKIEKALHAGMASWETASSDAVQKPKPEHLIDYFTKVL
jgi:hypothetical protein